MSTFSWLEYQWAFTSGAILLAVAAIWLLWVALLRDRSKGRRRCPKCWYDMSGVPSRQCPECGREARTERKLHATRRRWFLATFGMVLAILAVCGQLAPRTLEQGVASAIPIPILNVVLKWWDDKAEALYSQHVTQPAANGQRLVAIPTSTFERLLIASWIGRGQKSSRGTPSCLDSGMASLLERNQLALLGSDLRPALPVLREFSRDIDPRIRSSCLQLIRSCAEGGSIDALDELVRQLRYADDEVVRSSALNAILGCVFSQPRVRARLPRLLDLPLHDHQLSRVAERLVASSQGGSAEMNAIQRLLHDPRAIVRESTLEALAPRAAQGWPVAAKLAEECFRVFSHDPDADVRAAACGVLLKLKVDDARRIQLFEEGLADQDIRVRSACLIGLLELASSTRAAVDSLRRVSTSDVVPTVRAVVIRELYQFRDAAAIDADFFGSRLEDPAKEVVLAAVYNLKRMGSDARDQVGRLQRAKSGADDAVIALIDEAISEIERGSSTGDR